jgi:hypothetical protein
MKPGTQRLIFRWIHIIFGLSIFGYVYGPPEEVLQYRDNFRFIFVPVIVLSGLWMWKGHLVTRMFAKK